MRGMDPGESEDASFNLDTIDKQFYKLAICMIRMYTCIRMYTRIHTLTLRQSASRDELGVYILLVWNAAL